MTRNKSRSRMYQPLEPDREHCREMMVETIRDSRPEPVQYTPPPDGKKWWATAVVPYLPLNGSQKAVLACMIDHASLANGSCYPSEGRMAWETQLNLKTVQRAVSYLHDRTPYVRRQRRRKTSNAYHLDWGALRKAFDAFTERKANYVNLTALKDGVSRRRQADANVTPPDNVGGSGTPKVGGCLPPNLGAKLSTYPSTLNCLPERAACASHKSADVIPLEEKRATRREQASGSEYPTPSAPEEAWVAMQSLYMAAAAKVERAISAHPKKQMLNAEFDARPELFADAVRAETMEAGLGNAVLWEIVRGVRTKAWIASSVNKVPV